MRSFLVAGDFRYFDKYTDVLEKYAAQERHSYSAVLGVRVLLLHRQLFGGNQKAIRAELNSLMKEIDRIGAPTYVADHASYYLRPDRLKEDVYEALNWSAASVAYAQYYLGDFQAVLATFSRHPSIRNESPQAEMLRVMSTRYPNNELLRQDVDNVVMNWHNFYGWGETSVMGWDFRPNTDPWTIVRLQQLGYLENTDGTTGRQIVDAFVACASQGPGMCKFHSAASEAACSWLERRFICIRK